MNKIIRALIAITLVCASVSLNAQSLQLGYVKSTSVTTTSLGESLASIDGIQGGFSYDTEVKGSLSLNYGILYSYLFGTQTFFGVDAKTTVHNIDIPIRLVLKMPVPILDELEAFVYGGPDLGYCIANSTKYTLLGNEVKSSLYDDEDYSRFNLQLGVGGGLQFKNIVLKAGYDWGMQDMNKSDNVTFKTNAFTASVGFLF